MAATVRPPPHTYGVTHWSSRLLGKHLKVGDATVPRPGGSTGCSLGGWGRSGSPPTRNWRGRSSRWSGRRDAEDQARQEAQEKARQEAQEKARQEAQEKARQEAQEKARRDAEEKARQEAQEKARRHAEEKARQEAQEKARQEAQERARRNAEKKARREADEQARRDAEDQARQEAQKARREADEQARRDAEAQAGRDSEEAEQQARTDPQAREERAVTAASSPPEVVERVQPRSSVTARVLSRRWVNILAATLAIGGVVVLIAYLRSARPVEATIMSHLPDDLRASCTATSDHSATCSLADHTVVFYSLFDTVDEARTNVVAQDEIAPDGDPCPPAAPPVGSSVVCRYSVGAEKGLVRFSYTAKGGQSFYLARWSPDAEPLQGEMSTKEADPQDWKTLRENWKGLAGMR